MQSLVGLIGMVVLGVALVLGMRGAERAVARLLGLPSFRWFDVTDGPGWWWRRLLVRSASGLAPFAICAATFTVVFAIDGVSETTTAVTVLPDGAAREAGMRDGDKVLAVGGVPVSTWDALRAQVQRHDKPVSITVERAGERLVLNVTPRSGIMGVAPLPVKRPTSLAKSARLGFRLPIEIVSASFESLVATHERRVLKGPVAIVSETSKAGEQGALGVLHFLAILGSYFWPFVAALHVFDAATGWTFRLTFSEHDLPEATRRIARLRFSMHFALGCWAATVVAQLAVDRVPGALLVLFLLIPGVFALWPLMWVSARELWGKRALFGLLLPVTLVPCVAPIMGTWLALRLRDEERRLRSHQSAR